MSWLSDRIGINLDFMGSITAAARGGAEVIGGLEKVARGEADYTKQLGKLAKTTDKLATFIGVSEAERKRVEQVTNIIDQQIQARLRSPGASQTLLTMPLGSSLLTRV